MEQGDDPCYYLKAQSNTNHSTYSKPFRRFRVPFQYYKGEFKNENEASTNAQTKESSQETFSF